MTTSTLPKPFCFVLMPFSDDFTDVYQIGIKEACEKGGAYCERVDEQIFNETMLARIYNQIAKADFIVADMTGRNANVFYEVGYAHALGKPTILLTQKADDIPFDLKHFSHIVYGDKLSKLRDELTARVKWQIENPKRAEPQETLVLYSGKERHQGVPLVRFGNKEMPKLPFTLHNVSGRTLTEGDYKIAILVRAPIVDFRNSAASTQMPDGRTLIYTTTLGTLFPGAHCGDMILFHKTGYSSVGEQHDVTVRIFTDKGFTDYPFLLQCD